MSDLHLASGSVQPPKVGGKLRLYSMKFCPFAQRTRLVLLAKGVDHDIVNVNLFNKPEWLFNLNPKGQVPILDTGSEIILESTTICDYLDKTYPNPPLYSKDESQNQKDRDLLEDYGKNVIPKFYEAAWKKSPEKTLKEFEDEVFPFLQKLDQELENRGVYFGGETPKMIDYMMWPWAERAGVLEKVYETSFTIDVEKKLPRLFNWCKLMRNTDAVKKIITSTERHYKVTLFHFPGAVIDYDSI